MNDRSVLPYAPSGATALRRPSGQVLELGGEMPVVSLRDVLRTLFRRRWPMLAIMVGAVLCSIIYLMFESSSYTASTRVLVRVGREKLSTVSPADSLTGNFIFPERPENVNDEIEIMRGPAVLARALPVLRARLEEIIANAPRPPLWRRVLNGAKTLAKDSVTLLTWPVRMLLGGRTLTDDEALAEQVSRALGAASIKETNIFIAGFTWDNAEFAAFGMNTVLDAFMQEHVRVMSSAREATEFYRQQALRAEADLHQVAADLLGFSREAGLGDPTAEKNVVLTLVGTLERDLALAQVAETQAVRRAEEVRREFSATTGWPSTPAVPQVQLTQMADLDARYAEMTSRRMGLLLQFQPTSRDVRELDAQIAGLRAQKRDALLTYLNDRVRAEQQAQNATTERLQDARQRLDRVQTMESRYLELQGRRDQLLIRTRELHREIERLTLHNALDLQESASVRVLARATPPLLATWPKRSLVVGLAAAFGILLALAYAVFAEFFDRTVSTERDVERALGLPVLARLPELPRLT
jgi:uncharacterized protein involved in exopolysaccharide biosynthesis